MTPFRPPRRIDAPTASVSLAALRAAASSSATSEGLTVVEAHLTKRYERPTSATPVAAATIRATAARLPISPSATDWHTSDDEGGEMHHVCALRADFDRHAGRSLALPMAGAFVWALVGIAALLVPAPTAALVLLFATGAIFPLGLAIAHRLGERLLDNPSVLAGLMGRCVVMVNLLWALHLTVIVLTPSYLP